MSPLTCDNITGNCRIKRIFKNLILYMYTYKCIYTYNSSNIEIFYCLSKVIISTLLEKLIRQLTDNVATSLIYVL